MAITDLDRFNICMATARTMMMMAKALKRQGIGSYKNYVEKGIEACHLAIEYKRRWEEDSTDIIHLAA